MTIEETIEIIKVAQAVVENGCILIDYCYELIGGVEE